MKTIDITTAQNVTIEYPLAEMGDRIFAYVIDFIVIVAGMVFLRLIYLGVMPDALDTYADYLVSIPMFLFYTPASEMISHGRSIGKKAMGLQVVKLNGTEVGFTDYLIRWAFRMVDIYFSLGAIATLLVSSTARAQRLGDMLANTTVVRIRHKSGLELKNILSIQSIENYTPRYPEVRKMTEKDMLLVKTTLDRLKLYPNTAHREAADLLAETLCTHLGISNAYDNSVPFLKTLINDYIVLTR